MYVGARTGKLLKMNKAIITCILCFFTISNLHAQTTMFQQNGLVGLKQNGKVLVNARYRTIIPTGNLFLVTTIENEDKVIDIKDNAIIGASQSIDVLNMNSSIIYSVKPKGDSLFYLTDQKGKRIGKRGYDQALIIFYNYPSTSDYIKGFRKDTSDIYFKGKLIFTKNSRISVTGKGPMNNFLVVAEKTEKDIIAIDTSGHSIVVTKGDEYDIRNNYLITTAVERTASGYPSFLFSVYDKHLKFLFQTEDLIDPIDGADNLFIKKNVSFGIIDATQKVIVPFKFNDYKLISINKIPFTIMRNDSGRWTMYNEKCEVLSDGIYFDIAGSENEYAIVSKQYGARTDNLFYGLIDTRVNSIIQCRFNKIEFNKEKGKYIFNAQGKIYEYKTEEVRSNKVKINSLAKPVQ